MYKVGAKWAHLKTGDATLLLPLQILPRVVTWRWNRPRVQPMITNKSAFTYYCLSLFIMPIIAFFIF